MYHIAICLGARIGQSLWCLGFVVRFPAGARILLVQAFISSFIRSWKPAMRFEIFVVEVLKTFVALHHVVMEIFSRNIRSKYVRIISANSKNPHSKCCVPVDTGSLLQCQGLLRSPLRKKKRVRIIMKSAVHVFTLAHSAASDVQLREEMLMFWAWTTRDIQIVPPSKHTACFVLRTYKTQIHSVGRMQSCLTF